MPHNVDFSALLEQAMPLKTEDPMQFYTDMKKLGQGASGTVFVGTDVRNGEVCVCACVLKYASQIALIDLDMCN